MNITEARQADKVIPAVSLPKWNSVVEFKDWWLKSNRPFRPPFKNALFFTELVDSFVIYRFGNFQIELNLGRPNTETPYHKHPNVDTLFMYLTGNFIFGVDGILRTEMAKHQVENKQYGTHAMLGQVEDIGEASHNLIINEHGCAYFSFEHWKNGNPTGVAVNWEGPMVGIEHNKIIGEYKNDSK